MCSSDIGSHSGAESGASSSGQGLTRVSGPETLENGGKIYGVRRHLAGVVTKPRRDQRLRMSLTAASQPSRGPDEEETGSPGRSSRSIQVSEGWRPQPDPCGSLCRWKGFLPWQPDRWEAATIRLPPPQLLPRFLPQQLPVWPDLLEGTSESALVGETLCIACVHI